MRTKKKPLTVKLNGTAFMVLQLDEGELQRFYGVQDYQMKRHGKGLLCTVELTRPDRLLSDLEDRADGTMWDQPSSWTQACKRDAARLRKQLEELEAQEQEEVPLSGHQLKREVLRVVQRDHGGTFPFEPICLDVDDLLERNPELTAEELQEELHYPISLELARLMKAYVEEV